MNEDRFKRLENLVSFIADNMEDFQSFSNARHRNLDEINPINPNLNDGDTAWMLTSCALVLFMTMPGLALYYGGVVRAKNVRKSNSK